MEFLVTFACNSEAWEKFKKHFCRAVMDFKSPLEKVSRSSAKLRCVIPNYEHLRWNL